MSGDLVPIPGHLLLPEDRRKAIEAKRKKILRWFRHYPWSHPDVLCVVTDLGRRAVEKTLAAMERDGLVKHAAIAVAHARDVRLWGITHHGLHHAFELDEPLVEAAVFEPSKVAATTMEHDIQVQLVHAKGVNAGWTQWRPSTAVAAQLIERHLKIPDAIALSPSGEQVAIEFERTLKSGKRYSELLVSYLQGRKANLWSRVLYLSPTITMAARVERAYRSVKTARHKGQPFDVKAEHFAPFTFRSVVDFPGEAQVAPAGT